MADRKSIYIKSNYFHCFSNSISKVLGIKESEILKQRELLNIVINYTSFSLVGNLWEQTQKFLENSCEVTEINFGAFLDNLHGYADKKYCLMTETRNLDYSKAYQMHGDQNHYLIIEKNKSQITLIDSNFKAEGETVLQLSELKALDLDKSILLDIRLKKRKKVKSTIEILDFSDVQEVYFRYINNLIIENISLTTAVDFYSGGAFTSREVLVEIIENEILIDNNKSILKNIYSVLEALSQENEIIKLLLAKTYFSKSNSDLIKVKSHVKKFYEFDYMLLNKCKEVLS
ncbi:hypothetical protein JKS34_13660 [Listeria monocytogenes]|nr:hypothetical protein [Listeria monocytogenes]MCP8093360.1 hypothetical protein [Listeria monocytogenes]MCP8130842.1 hypothetical protein [Listeria monocytogenes]